MKKNIIYSTMYLIIFIIVLTTVFLDTPNISTTNLLLLTSGITIIHLYHNKKDEKILYIGGILITIGALILILSQII